METHFAECPVCKRKVLVQITLAGDSHNLALKATCGLCIKAQRLDLRYRKRDSPVARKIQAWAMKA